METGHWERDAWTQQAHLSRLLVTSSTRLRFPEPWPPPLRLSPAHSGVVCGSGRASRLRRGTPGWRGPASREAEGSLRLHCPQEGRRVNSPRNGLRLPGSGHRTGGRDDSASTFRADKRNKLAQMAPGTSGVQTPGCGPYGGTPSISGSPELLYEYRMEF